MFGFLQDSFTGQEQGQSHRVQVGYRKGAASAQTNLRVIVQHKAGTAGEYTGVTRIAENLIKVDLQLPNQ